MLLATPSDFCQALPKWIHTAPSYLSTETSTTKIPTTLVAYSTTRAVMRDERQKTCTFAWIFGGPCKTPREDCGSFAVTQRHDPKYILLCMPCSQTSNALRLLRPQWR
jgi:hypothetical protein